MPEKQTTRKPAAAKKRAEHRPRIDAVLRAIKEGKYDEEMNLLAGAIQDRRTKRQEAVMALVHETFGDDYAVVPRTNRGALTKTLHSDPPVAPPEGWVDTTGQSVAPEDEQGTGPSVKMSIEGEEDGIESRSPIIGPGNPA